MENIKEKTYRYFFALPIDKTACKQIENVSAQLKKVPAIGAHNDIINWTKIENLHLTMLFLGPQKESTIKDLIERYKNDMNHTAQFKLPCHKLGTFPSNKPHTIALLCDQHRTLNLLVNELHQYLAKLNIKHDTKKFIPHITLARMKKSLSFNTIDIDLKINIKKFVLFKSDTQSQGPVYTPIAEFYLETRH